MLLLHGRLLRNTAVGLPCIRRRGRGPGERGQRGFDIGQTRREWVRKPLCFRRLTGRRLLHRLRQGLTVVGVAAVVLSLGTASSAPEGFSGCGTGDAGASTLPRMIGKPSLLLPTMTILELEDCAS